jgi:hypothetical protein
LLLQRYFAEKKGVLWEHDGRKRIGGAGKNQLFFGIAGAAWGRVAGMGKGMKKNRDALRVFLFYTIQWFQE